MRLHVVQTSGIPPDSIVSVKSGSSRRQQPLPCQAPFKLDQPPVPVHLEVLSYAARGQEVRLPAPTQELLKVPLTSKQGNAMSVTFRVQKTESVVTEETCQTPKISRKEKEAVIEAYLAKHKLHDFMKEVFQGLTKEQPEDPFVYIARRLQDAAQKDAGCEVDLPSVWRVCPDELEESGSVLQTVGDVTPPPQDAAQQKSATMQRLRRKARESLSKGYLDGRLQTALHNLPEQAEAALLLPQQDAMPSAANAVPQVQANTNVHTEPAPAHPTIVSSDPAGQIQSSQVLAGGSDVPLEEAAVLLPSASPGATCEPEQQAAAVVTGCQDILSQVVPFSALPAPSAWVLTDAENDEDIHTPRLSRFSPGALRRKPSAQSETSYAVSDDLLDFVPDRSSWLLHGDKDRPQALPRMAPSSRWSHRSLSAEKQALQAVLSEFTPRMSSFIPVSKEPPPTPLQHPSELLHFMPDERMTSAEVRAVHEADPDLHAFMPMDPGMAGGLAAHPGPFRELTWPDVWAGRTDGVSTPRLTQFMPSYPSYLHS